MKIDKDTLFELYMNWANDVFEECDWKTSLSPKEIVYAISNILENNPHIIKNDINYKKDDKE